MPDPSWRQLLTHEDLELGSGCTEKELADASLRGGFELPTELAEMLREVNGVYDCPGQWFAAWPLDRVVENLPRLRDSGLPASLLPFGDNGLGEPFCLQLGDVVDTSVLIWYPITKEVTRLAPSLRRFWLAWLAGGLLT